MENRDCVFCAIVAGRAPAHLVLEDQHSLCILDINPFTEGHCLVISRRHVPWWHDLSDEETASLFCLAKKAAIQLGMAFSPEFVCMYARGRRVPHTHVFLVPTRKGDVLDGFFNALEKFQESPPALAELRSGDHLALAADKIRRAGETSGRDDPAGQDAPRRAEAPPIAGGPTRRVPARSVVVASRRRGPESRSGGRSGARRRSRRS